LTSEGRIDNPLKYYVLSISEKIYELTRKMHLHNADVVKKFIFRYHSVLLTDGLWNIFMNITNKDIPNKIIELNKFLNNVCIIWVKWVKTI
jgi:hypothetical protein